MAVVSLRAVAEEMEVCLEGFHIFLNRRTGELYEGTDESLVATEEDDDESLPAWQQEVVIKLREVMQSADWLEVPARSAGEDYRIMERFCLEHCDGQLQEKLLSAIQGPGAFGRFKDAVHRWGIQNDWYRFRLAALSQEAAAWLDSEKIAYRE